MADFSRLSAEDRDVVRHWTEYGQRGATPNRRILPSDWPSIKPFVAPKTSEWSIPIAAHQLPLLIAGFLPSESDTASIQKMIEAGLFEVGDYIQTHAYMSTSQNNLNHVSEDKWFIYTDGPDADGKIDVHMHRSWTGLKSLQLSIQADRLHSEGCHSSTGLARITGITWEPNASMSEEEDEEDAKDIALGVCEWVLNVDLEETQQTVRRTPEELSIMFGRAIELISPSGPQTLNRTGYNPWNSARAYA
ncbi:hypothetical protein C7974DRAFT_21443 [Boeremia exigua]|uniref:uncharacterized protein n=1 Tax=Boeremia exigua TaxID=749465 RepID=UPI001E8EB52A|nr:uncharacterized protein C7974DRAFT_21443 [Boeremia exigua]KAH6644451.1 hypothetical protein C7974DRAFT_21443 [Boeremia exigua]